MSGQAFTLGGDRYEPVSRPRLAVVALVLGLLIGSLMDRWGRDAVLSAYQLQNEELRQALEEQQAAVRFCNERVDAIWPGHRR